MFVSLYSELVYQPMASASRSKLDIALDREL